MNTQTESWISAEVVALRELSATVREITLRTAGGAIAWTVGSHLRVRIVHADGRPDLRRYSLVGLPAPGADWRIAVKRADPGRGGSAFMWRLALGDRIEVQRPDNHFELPLGPRATLLLAGGIGITPLLGMALALAPRRAELRMVYAAPSSDELVYRAELEASLGPRLQCLAGSRIDVDAEIAALAPSGQLLVCGPVPMLQAVQAAWHRARRPPQRLRFETFGNSGSAPAEAFWVELPRHELAFAVPADRSLLEMLEVHGVACLADCMRGECGLCAVDVVELHGTIDHRDVFFSAGEKAQGRKLCTCVSRVVGGGVVIDSAWRPDTLPP